jgi:hypothetical protein
MAEIYCKRCLHHEELGRALKADEKCPACGAGVHRRNGKPPRPSTHFVLVLRAILSWRGLGFLVVFSLFGMIPVGALAWAAIIMLFLGGLKLALKSMQVVGGKIEFPEISPEELLDKSALVPALAYVFLFVWLPPILIAFGISGAFTLDPAEDLANAHAVHKSTKHVDAASSDDAMSQALANFGGGNLGNGGAIDPQIASALKQAGVPSDALQGGKLDEATLKKALEDAPGPQPRLKNHVDIDAIGALCIALGVLLFLWAPMAVVLYLRTSSTVAMLYVPAGVRTMLNDPLGYLELCLFVLPALAFRFFVDAYTSTTLIAAPWFLAAKGAAVLVSWALCGLYVRSHARAFELPVDDDDWTPHGNHASPPAEAMPVVQGQPIR